MSEPSWESIAEIPLTQWRPRRQVTLPETTVSRSAFPAIDVHNHLGRWLTDDGWMIDDVPALVASMDACNVRTIVNLDGMWGQELSENLERYDRAFPGRFLTFCQLDWELLGQPDGAEPLISSLDDSAARGARGVKVWKNLGLKVRDADGELVMPDDPSVIRVLEHAGKLDLPVLIHVADPKAFFDPLDEHNERLDELLTQRDWWFGDREKYPTFERLVDGLARLVLATPGTSYIGAHVGCVGEDLDWVERLLGKAGNFAIDIGGRMGEIGRQPRRFVRLIERFPDRVLFGTDVYPIQAADYALQFRFLETADEVFDYSPGSEIPPQGRWTVSALDLNPDQLEAIYAGNAIRVLGLE